MSSKLKGIYKSFKYISQLFVVKEREMEIGYPTDVKHVAHIGCDGLSGNAPSWMNEFKTAPDHFSSAGSFGDISDRRDSTFTAVTALTTWSSQDYERSSEFKPANDMFKELPNTETPNITKKSKHKKSSSPFSTKSSLSSTSRSSRFTKSKAAAYNEFESTPNFQV